MNGRKLMAFGNGFRRKILHAMLKGHEVLKNHSWPGNVSRKFQLRLMKIEWVTQVWPTELQSIALCLEFQNEIWVTFVNMNIEIAILVNKEVADVSKQLKALPISSNFLQKF